MKKEYSSRNELTMSSVGVSLHFWSQFNLLLSTGQDFSKQLAHTIYTRVVLPIDARLYQ